MPDDEAYVKARESAERAIVLDQALADALTSLTFVN